MSRKLYSIHNVTRHVVDTMFFHEANFFYNLHSNYIVLTLDGGKIEDLQPIPMHQVFAAQAAKDKK